MPTIKFMTYNKNDNSLIRYRRASCSSPWDVFQLLNRQVKSCPLSTIYANGHAIADPNKGWHELHPHLLRVFPKHSEDMEEMEAFAVELWELACRLTQETSKCT